MRAISFYPNVFETETRDVTELVTNLSTDNMFDDAIIHVAFDSKVDDKKNIYMTTVQYTLQAAYYVKDANKYISKKFMYKNYRAKDFCCQNKEFKLISE